MDKENGGISLGQRAFILAKVLQALPLYFAHWEDAQLGQDELDAAFAALAEEAMACDSRREFSLLLMAFFAKLNNGHTRFRDFELEDALPLGMTLKYIEERWVVIAFDHSALQSGDIIHHIEDKPVETWYEELSSYTVGSPHSRRVQFGEGCGVFPSLLQGLLPDYYTVEVEDARGDRRTVTVDRAALDDPIPPCIEGRWLEDELAYIKIPSFLQPGFEERALAYIKEFKEAAGLIVDVRHNGGGSTPWGLFRALMDRPYRWWTESSPLTVGVLDCQAQLGHRADMFSDSHLLWRSPVNDPDPEGYPGQLVILADHATWSAGEDFIMPFKDNGRAVLIGETTGGSTGQPYFHTFENGMAFAIGTQRVYMPDATPFEGIGHMPDIPVELRREDLIAGRDPVLEKAVAVIKE